MTTDRRFPFSSRVPWSAEVNPLTAEVERRRAAGLPLLDLTVTNPTRAGLAYPEAEIRAALARAELVDYEPAPRGLRPAREAVAAYHAAQGSAVDADRVFLTASTSEAYALLFKLLADPGEAVLVPEPSYPLFEHLAVLDAVRIVPYRLRYDDASGWRVDLESVRRGLRDAPRAVIAVSPNNPTGSCLLPEELDALDRLCAESRAAFVADEVFFDYRADGAPPAWSSAAGERRALTFTLSGLSKAAALPQLKLGWIVAGGPPALRDEALARLEFAADAYLSVAGPVQHAAAELLGLRRVLQRQILARVGGNEALLAAHWPAAGGRLRRRDGGWSAVLELPPGFTDEAATTALLAWDGVLVHPGYFYDFAEENILVVSLLTPPEDFRSGLEALLARVRA